jgi:hypothetical protein
MAHHTWCGCYILLTNLICCKDFSYTMDQNSDLHSAPTLCHAQGECWDLGLGVGAR